MNTFARLRTALGIDDVHAAIANLTAVVRAHSRDAIAPVPPPPPFVMVLVQGDGPRGPTSLGACGDAGKLIELTSNLPLTDVEVIVFADMRRVRVSVFLGVDLLAAAVGSCPFAYAASWMPGVKLYVDASER
jgi:hypothetical protein